MSERIVPADQSTARTRADPALRAAWTRFIDFDNESVRQKQQQFNVRTPIIVLMFLASTLAVVISYDHRYELISDLHGVLRAALIIVPLAAAGLMAYAYQFSPSLSWIGYRIGAEEIRQQIYLYRLEAGPYASHTLHDQQQKLLDEVDKATNRVHEIGTPGPFIHLSLTTEPVAARTDREEDDGYTRMTGDEYAAYRVIPQTEWYIKRLHDNYRNLRRWRIAILVVAAASSALAALGGEPLVAISTALGLALSQYIDLKMYGHTYTNFHHTAGRLITEMGKWQIMPAEDRRNPQIVGPFVSQIERIFEDERNNWMQQAVQAQTANEQAILKQLGRQPLQMDALIGTMPAADARRADEPDTPTDRDGAR